MKIEKEKRLIIEQKSFWMGVKTEAEAGRVVFTEMAHVWPVHSYLEIESSVNLNEAPKERKVYFPFGQYGTGSEWDNERSEYFFSKENDWKNYDCWPKPDMLRIYFHNLDVDSRGDWWWNHDNSYLTARYIVANVADVEKKGEIPIYYSAERSDGVCLMHFRKEFGWDRNKDAYYLIANNRTPWPFPATKSFLRIDKKVKPLPDSPDWAYNTGAVYLRTGKQLNRYSLWAVIADDNYPAWVDYHGMMLERKAIYKAKGEQYNIAWYPPQIVNVWEEEDKSFLATVITPLIQQDKVKIEGRWYNKDGKHQKTENTLIAKKRLKDNVYISWELIGSNNIKETLWITNKEVSTLSYRFLQEQVKNKTGYNIVNSLRQIFNLNLTEKETEIIGNKGIEGYNNSYFLYRSNLKKLTYAGKFLLYSFKRGV